MKKAPSGAFFISREADAEHGQSAYTCPLPARHGPLFCPLERRGPRSAERWQDSRTMYDSGPLDTKTPRQDSRPMHDSEALDAKMPPPWQRSRAMYPKSPDCIPKQIHGTKILPSSARKECISRERCQGGASFRAIGEKRMHSTRILPHQPKQPYGHDEAMGRRSTSLKEGPGATAKSPNTKAIPTRPSFLAPRSSAQINLPPKRFPQGRRSSQPETENKATQHQGSLEKSCLRKLIRRSSMSA